MRLWLVLGSLLVVVVVVVLVVMWQPGMEAPDSSSSDGVPPLPVGWARAHAEDGGEYYFHVVTKKTTWDFPDENTPIEVVSPP